MVLLAGSWRRILVHRGPAIVSIDTVCGLFFKVEYASAPRMRLFTTPLILPSGVGFARKYEARLSAGFSGGPRWLGLCPSSGGPARHPSGDNKHGVWGKVATPKKKGVVPYVGATFRLVVKGTPRQEGYGSTSGLLLL